MKRSFHRLTALVLSAVLMASELSIPVYADPVSEENPEVVLSEIDQGLEGSKAEEVEEDASAGEKKTEDVIDSDDEKKDDEVPAADEANKSDTSYEDEAKGREETDTEKTVTVEKEAEEDIDSDELLEDGEEPGEIFKTGYNYIPGEEDVESIAVFADDADDELMELVLNDNLPSSYTTHNLPNLRNQNPYGSCWAHAAMATAELNSQKNELLSSPDLSELHLAYFSYYTPDDPTGRMAGDRNWGEYYDENDGLTEDSSYYCPDFLQRGGNQEHASVILSSWIGAADESTARYGTASSVLNKIKNGQAGLSDDIAYSDAVHLKNVYKVNTTTDADRDAIKRMVRDLGGAAVSFYAVSLPSAGFTRTYTINGSKVTNTQIYNSTNNCYYLSIDPGRTNHAVTIVGWDDGFLASKFGTNPGKPGAWLIRNSWTDSASENSYYGYFWLSYYDKGLARSAAWGYEYDSAQNYQHNYQYDGSVQSISIDVSDTVREANVFEVSSSAQNESLKAVSFWSDTTNLNYKVEIFKNPTNESNPMSGDPVSTVEGTTSYAGYYTVPLSTPVSLKSGNKFSVVITLTKTGDTISIPLECGWTPNRARYDWYGAEAHAENNQSFIQEKSGSNSWYAWDDASKYYGNWQELGLGNLRIKAFTVDANSTTPQYTVTLNANGGKFSNGSDTWTDTKSEGTVVTLPTPTRTGYTFNGWYTSATGGTLVSSPVTLNADTTLYAGWTAKTNTLTLNANLGTFDGGSSTTAITITYDQKYGTLPTPTRPGYKLVGWFDTSSTSGGNEITSNTVHKTESDRIIYARWTPAQYKVTFNANGGTCDTTEATVTYNQKYTFLPTPSKSGYVFDGWYLEDSFVNKVTKNVTKVTATSDHTLYAKWKMVVKVTFNANGGNIGTATTQDINEFYNSDYTLPSSDPTRTGYTFVGWFTEQEDGKGVQVTNTTKVSKTTTHTLYAHWTDIKYTLTLDSNGGLFSNNQTTTTKSITYGKAYGTLDKPTREGYDCDGWSTSKTGSVNVSEETVLTSESNKKIYAHWKAKTCTVTFDANGGKIGTENTSTKTETYDSNYELPSAPTRTGYRFVGWFTDTEYTTQVTTSTNVKKYVAHTLYAKWTIKTFDVTFNANGGKIGSYTSANVNQTYNSNYKMPDDPERTGYDFVGWYTEQADGSGTKVTTTDKVEKESTHTLYAHWKAKTYTLTMDGNGGKFTGDKTQTTKPITFDQTYGTLTKPTRYGYDCDGWSTSSNGSVNVYESTKANGDRTIYAHWKAKTIKVNFNANGGTCSKSSMTVTYDKTYGNLPTPTLSGKEFAGWYLEDGDTPITKDSIVKIESEHSLVAHWTSLPTYTVTFNANYEGGTNTEKNVAKNSAIGELPSVSDREFYNFLGWFTSATGGVKVTETTVITGPVTYYAHWEKAATCVVTFDENFTSGNKETVEVKKGGRLGYIPDGVSNRYGYNFTTWSTAKKGGQNVTEDTIINSNITVYAQWVAKTYVLQFDPTGGQYTLNGEKKITFDAKYGTLPTATRNGYKFTGWFTQISGGELITANSIVKTEGGAEGHKLYAHWDPNAYQVVFDATGGICSFESKTVYFDGKYGELPAASRPGYEFKGWFPVASNGSEITANTDVTNYSNHTLYAQWTPKKYKVAFDPNGGSCATAFWENVPYMSKYGDLPTPAWNQNQRAFVGWFTEKGQDKGIRITKDSLFTFTDNDHTLYAHWEDWGEVLDETDKKDREGKTVESIASDNFWVRGVPAETNYTGLAIKYDDLRVYRSNKLLVKDVDYTLSYKNNTKAGTADVIITGKGNYNGKRTEHFTIKQLSLADGKAKAVDISLLDNGKMQKGTTTVYYTFDDGRTITLKNGTDYYYPNDAYTEESSGVYDVRIEGKGNYFGPLHFKEKILAKTDTFHMIGKATITITPSSRNATGSEIKYDDTTNKIIVTAKDGKETKTLVEKKTEHDIGDYEIEYKNNILPGTATVIIKGLTGGPNGDFYGTKTATFKINATSITKATFELSPVSASYTGAPIKPTVTVKYAEKKNESPIILTKDADYTIGEYSNNINAGKNKAYVTVIGKGKFTGTTKKMFTIDPVSVANSNIGNAPGNIEINVVGTNIAINGYGDIPHVRYQKGGTKPAISVVFHGKDKDGNAKDYTLVEGKDYTLSFKNNGAVNTTFADAKKIPTVTITGKGNFTGKIEKMFAITAANSSDVKVVADDVVYKNKVGNFVPKLTITDTGGKTLAANTDYDKNIVYRVSPETKVTDKKGGAIEGVTDLDPKVHVVPAGTLVTALITLKNNYVSETVTATFRVVKNSIASATVKIRDKEYTGKQINICYEDIVSIKMGKIELDPSDYTIDNCYVNINKGTGKAVIRGRDGGNYGCSKVVTFKILNKKLE